MRQKSSDYGLDYLDSVDNGQFKAKEGKQEDDACVHAGKNRYAKLKKKKERKVCEKESLFWRMKYL